jgi:hypothetical protein
MNSARTSPETHYVSATKPNQLMLFRETVAVYCENRSHFTTKGESVCLGVGHPLGAHDQILLFLSFAGKLLCSSSWVALSDERTGL